MKNSATGFVSLLLVIGASIVFGMVVGGKLNAPPVALAAPASTIELAPASMSKPEGIDFADIVESAMPAVVSVRSTKLAEARTEEEEQQQEQLWEWFFGPNDRNHQRQPDRDRPQIGEGSGFVISRDGYVLTNHHVVDGADQVEVGMADGIEMTARVVGTDPSIDLALLKIDSPGKDLPTLPLGDSDDLRVGQWVIAIGNPLDYEQTVTVGVVSAKQRRVPIGNTDSGLVSFIQTDAAINFGNSGGPLLDARGNVVGINTAIRRANYAEGIGFALPISQARNVIEQLRDQGRVRRGFIGINMNANGIDETVRDYYGLPDTNGVLVDRVNDPGPAHDAGLKAGDIIRRVDGEPVRDNLDLISKIAGHQPGDEVKLDVYRGGETKKLRATLGDREAGLRAATGRRGGPEQPEVTPEEAESSGLGITVKTLGSREREELELTEDQPGVLITDVEFDSLAADRGIQPNMLVTGVNDRPVRDVSDWIDAIESLAPGDPVKLDIRAGTNTQSVFLRMPSSDD